VPKNINHDIFWHNRILFLQHKIKTMPQKRFPISEIHQKHYNNISEEDFIKIASTDTISSKPLTHWQKKYNRLISKKRWVVERTFGGMRRWFRCGMARYI